MEQTTEFFIERVRDNPCLWNTSHVSYRDISKKDGAWRRVAKECKMMSGKDAKTQWKKLRDSHREAMRRRKTSGQTVQYLKPWKYEDAMKFVLPLKERKETFPNQPTESIDDFDIDDILSNDVEDLGSEKDYFDKEKKKEDDGRKDPLAILFDSFYHKTRELPKFLQLRVQREIFESINRAEEETLSFDTMQVMHSSPMSSPSSFGYSNANVVDLQEYDSDLKVE